MIICTPLVVASRVQCDVSMCQLIDLSIQLCSMIPFGVECLECHEIGKRTCAPVPEEYSVHFAVGIPDIYDKLALYSGRLCFLSSSCNDVCTCHCIYSSLGLSAFNFNLSRINHYQNNSLRDVDDRQWRKHFARLSFFW